MLCIQTFYHAYNAYNDIFLICLDLLGTGLSLSEFVEQLSKNFIALHLHCVLMNHELFFLNESSFHTLSMYGIKSYEN